jgi:predicted DNA-binding transcriptional regulator YafY
MNRIDRLVGIVLMLQSKRLLRAEDIAHHFDVSVRTVYRDIQALCEAGVPVAGEAGVGYSLVAGYSLPPVMFSEEEASALIIGGEFVRSMTDESLHKSIRSALMKIRAVLPADKKEYVERLQSSIAVFTRPASYHSDLSPEVMQIIQRAIVHRTVLTIDYESRGGESTKRDIEPLNLIYYGANWHLIAHCRLRKGIRDFRADRIQAPQVHRETFIEPEGYSLASYLQQQYTLEHPIEVLARFHHAAAQGLSQKYYYGFVDEKELSGSVVMRFIVPSLPWIGRWLLSFTTAVEVLAPVELQEFMRDEALRVVNTYAPPPAPLPSLDVPANTRVHATSLN